LATRVSGHLEEAERLADEAVRGLEKSYPPDDPVLLRPLQVLAAVRLESGTTAKARDAITRLQSLRIERPEDGAVVHATTGALLQIEGRRFEAETEYREALHAMEAAGRSESADAGAVLHCLAALFLDEERLEEARRTLESALVIYGRAKDAVPMDRMKFLDLRGVMHARAGEWREAEEDLREALSLADHQRLESPGLFRMILVNYAYVLRRNHHRREARHIEARAASLPIDRRAAAVVDLSALRAAKKVSRKSTD
jgi:tetratricopeptide (TPR) repeat protein